MPARCETCRFWIPGGRYVEGGSADQQTGFCKFSPEPWKSQSWHWCGKWQAPVDYALSSTPAHTAAAADRYARDCAADFAAPAGVAGGAA